MDENFKKGYVPLRPDTDVQLSIDASESAHNHLLECMSDYNLIYTELATKDGLLDQYLAGKGWEIDYADLGSPHNGRRPMP